MNIVLSLGIYAHPGLDQIGIDALCVYSHFKGLWVGSVVLGHHGSEKSEFDFVLVLFTVCSPRSVVSGPA